MFKIIKRTEDGEKVLGKGSNLEDLTTQAQTISSEDTVELEIIDNATGAVILVTSPLTPGSFVPWTRVETPKFVAPHFADWRPAYTRKRVGAVVYRSLTSKSWMVLDTRTGGAIVVGTTVEAREITNKMRSEGFSIPAAAEATSAASA